jgi:hypothetical protein
VTVTEEGEGDTRDLPRGSPELGERRSGRATAARRRWKWNLTGRLLELKKDEREAMQR